MYPAASEPTRPQPKRYFLDESGHGGDLASARTLDFAGQPMFALACVGVTDEVALRGELDRLRRHYRCSEGELKSSALGARLPAVSAELLSFLDKHGTAFFIELVDKRYFAAINLVTYLLCRPFGLSNLDMASRIMMAEFLADECADAVLIAYLEACRSSSKPAVASLIDQLWAWLDDSDVEIARTTQFLTMFARDRVRGKSQADEFLPIADVSVTGKKVWMLPNLQSLTNIYARINQSRTQGLDGTELVHDEQMQYAKILRDAKALMDGLAAENALPVVPFADYRLRGTSLLTFSTALADPCLQAADILAGCAMRFAREGRRRNGRVSDDLRAAFDAMIDATDPIRATGVNLVMSTRMLQQLGAAHLPTHIGWD